MNNLVTVVTVTYNAEDLLEETMLSVINQSYNNIEYIIIDGASTDKTIDIIKKYEDKIDYWISEPDDGIYFAMNKAIEKASGEWINFMNAGDTFANNDTVQYLMENLDKNADLVYGDYFNSKRELCTVEDRQNILESMPCCHQSLYVRTRLMKENPFNTSYRVSADYEFILKMYKEEKKFQYIKEPLCVYLEGGFSEKDIIRRDLETIALYVTSQMDAINIINSYACGTVVKQSLLFQEKIAHINRQAEWIKKQEQLIEGKTNDLRKLRLILQELTNISFFKHPIDKLKKYKQLRKEYYRQK